MILLPILLLFFLFVLGLVVGSFLNVVIQRCEHNEPLTGRSHCDTCGKTLSWTELFPIASFIYQKGRCLHCGTVLSIQYPLVEFATGFVFAALAGRELYEAVLRGNMFSFAIVCVLLAVSAAMIVIVVADFNYHIIPNGSVLLLALLGIAVALVRNGLICISGNMPCPPLSLYGAVGDIMASIAAMFFLFAIWYLSKGRAMGFGDVKLIGATSLLLGFPLSLVGLVFSFWLGGIWGIILLLLRARTLKSQIAFGPFIVAGTALAYFFGRMFLISSGFFYLLH